jgi:CRISPR type I-E-associated protein CasB/Cse2
MTGESKHLSAVVAGLAGVIGHDKFPKGDLAELRRLRPETPPPAYWRLLFDRVPEDWRREERQERAWAIVMSGMAVMAPRVHASSTPLGRVMARIGGSTAESRLWQLLRVRGEPLEDHIRILARFLAAKEERIDWADLARLLLIADEGKRDAVCRKLARDFYMDESRQQPANATD